MRDVQRLRELRTQFGGNAPQSKCSLLLEFATRRLDRSRIILAYHDILLFIAAHADDAQVAGMVDAELRRVGLAAASLPTRESDSLISSGIAGTAVETGFTVDMVDRLIERFGDAITIAWDNDGSAGKAFDDALQWCAGAVESVGLLSTDLTTQQWLDMSGMRGSDAVKWIIKQLRAHCTSHELCNQVFDRLDIPLRWTLAAEGASRTLTRMPKATSASQETPLKRAIQFSRVLRERLPEPTALPVEGARRMIDAAQDALATRGRETDPVTFAHEREVYHVPTGHGFDINLFGIKPKRRLPLESFIGYVAARNGVPVGYGGAWIFYDQAAIGINIFDEFRGGESAVLFAQIMRVYHWCCGARVFFVDPFQFGADNEEGLRSGAFWFYYRFGYRPDDAELRALAREEWGKIQEDRNYRSPIRVLRKLATRRLVLCLKGARRSDTPDQIRLGLTATAHIGEKFHGDRAAAQRHAVERIASIVGQPHAGKQADGVRLWFNELAVAINTIDDLESWSKQEKRQLGDVLSARGGALEIDYLHALKRCDRLRRAWLEVNRAMTRRLRAMEDH